MEAFIARYRNVTILAAAIFAQILLLGYQVRGNHDVRLIRIWGVTAITPVARMLDESYRTVSGFWNDYIWLRGARQQNRELQAELGRLKLENQALENELGAAGRLQLLASYQQTIPSETKVAHVIGTGANPNSRAVFLDMGSLAGAKPGMAVITPDGIVGRVQSVFPSASLALLVSDGNSGVGVILEKSRAHAVMRGTGLNGARLEYVPNEEKVTAGEKIYTSGEDRIFPKGLIAGTVTSAQSGRDFQDILVETGAKLNKLEDVLVVTQGVHQELPNGMPRAQAPEVLLPSPLPEMKNDLGPAQVFLPTESASGPSATAQPDNNPVPNASAPPPQKEPGQPASVQPAAARGYAPHTEADLLLQRYRDLGRAQGHVFGEGVPGSKPPDFNMGLNVGARRPAGTAAAPPSGAGTSTPGGAGARKAPVTGQGGSGAAASEQE